MVTGMRGLCNGLGPAVFGLIFYLFNVNLNEDEARQYLEDQMSSANKKGQDSAPSVEFTNGNGSMSVDMPQHLNKDPQLLRDVNKIKS